MADAIEWDRVRLPNGKTKLVSVGNDGEWSIIPVISMGGNEYWCDWRLCFRPTSPASRENIFREHYYNGAPRLSREAAALRHAHLGYEIPLHGTFWSEEAAIIATNTLVFGDPTGSTADILAAAGFVADGLPCPDTYRGKPLLEQEYRKEMIGGAFKLNFGNWANLIFDIADRPKSEEPWEIGNVCRDAGSSNRFPIFWPQTIEDNFQVLALRAVLAVMDRYIASGELALDIRDCKRPSTVSLPG